MSFSGFHYRMQLKQHIKDVSVVMPLLHESTNSLAMVRHCMDVIQNVIHPCQIPIITADQPVYALEKRIQWVYPEEEHGISSY